MLHGAGGNAHHGLDILKPDAEEAGVIVLAPESRKTSWDIISDAQYGPDVHFINQCLEHVFSRCHIDPARIALGGFSDGASYALSLGLTNGQLFTKILAFSPGFMAPLDTQGNPSIFISHGTRDEVLPIDRCSRTLIPVLRMHGLRVEYREFDGPHTVPPEMKRRAVQILTEA
jgi:phospholipase/carboxylesterase